MTDIIDQPADIAAPPFGEIDALRWMRFFGLAAHRAIPFDLYSIEHEGGQVRLAASSAMSVGIYVVVDFDSCVRYIGKVCRRAPTAIQDRFVRHHAATLDWTAVWLLPLEDHCSDDTVRALEAVMISAFRPDGNTQHVPAGRSRRPRRRR